jgi:TolB-like protein
VGVQQAHELKAVLVADVEGYTRLMSRREHETHALTNSCLELFRELVPEHQGTLIKTTGDGVVIEFKSAISAVRYGIDIQQKLQDANASIPDQERPKFRIGVHLGEIMREGGDIYGHSVNVATRIEQFADPNGIVVSEVVYEFVHRSMNIGFECIGSRELKNIDTAITIYKVRTDLDAAVMVPTKRKPLTPLTLPDRPSIAVLPFDHPSENEDARYLADGVSEDIITCLSKFDELFVIARKTSFFYRNAEQPTHEIAAELGVRYMLEGSVRKSGNRVRINTQLVDCVQNHGIWAEKYDFEVEDIFEVQDNVANAIVATIGGRLKVAEAVRRNELATENLKAYGELLHGRELLQKYTSEGNAAAQVHFKRALEHDPDYAPACAAMARARNYDWQFEWGETSDDGLTEAVDWAQRAVSLDRSSPRAHAELGFSLLFSKKLDRSIEEFRTALDLNPNDSDIMAEMADALTYSGQADEAETLLEKAIRLNPYHPDTYLWYMGDAYFVLRQYRDAIEAMERMTNPSIGCRLLAACYAHLDEIEHASTHAQQVLKMQPEFSVNDWVKKQPEINPKDTEHLAEGLLKAGLPA